MKRRINSTERKKINLADISVHVSDESSDENSPNCLELELSLKKYRFPAHASIIVEVTTSRNSRVLRINDIGKIGDFRKNGDVISTRLDLSTIEARNYTLRIKIVDTREEVGKILGIGNVRYSTKGASQSFMAIDVNEELGDIPWTLECNNNQLCIQINHQCRGLYQKLSSDPTIQALLLPAILRMALEKSIQEGDSDDDDEENNDLQRCLEFGKSLHPDGEACPFDEDYKENELWMDCVVEAFCQKNGFVTQLSKSLATVDEEDER